MTDRPDLAAPAMPASPRTAAHSDLWWWLRGAGTRRMFARALGGGEQPNDTYLRMATAMLDKVANEVESKPWLGTEAAQQAAPLDVPALAEALNATVGKYGWARSTPESPVEEWLVNAGRVAAEYARLAPAQARPAAAALREALVELAADTGPAVLLIEAAELLRQWVTFSQVQPLNDMTRSFLDEFQLRVGALEQARAALAQQPTPAEGE